MEFKKLENGYDAEAAYQITLLQSLLHDYNKEFDSLTAEEQIKWAIISAKMNSLGFKDRNW